MTLAEVLPTLRRSLTTRLDREAWPLGATLDAAGELTVGGVRMSGVAATFGTPTYVLDEAQVRARCAEYRAALPDFEISYASKALLTRAVARWMREEGLSLDVCSAGELAVARAADFPGERITMHGNAKTPEDVKAALRAGVGRFVLDSLDEIAALGPVARHPQDVLIRITPGVDGHTHPAIATGVEDQKFGFPIAAAAEAVRAVLAQPSLRLVGLHCHIGSQITRVADFEAAARRMVGVLAAIHAEHGITLPQLNLGGGHAVSAADGGFDLTGFATRMRVAVNYECGRAGLAPPALAVEPGRALVARAGLTLYRVVTVKHGAARTFVAVDGGMSDNPRPALYGARYAVLMFGRPGGGPVRPVTVVGRHCEAGDVLATEVGLPADVRAGDLLAVPGCGAYHHSLASTYNLVGRPPVIAVRDGVARQLVRRETEDDLLVRDIGG